MRVVKKSEAVEDLQIWGMGGGRFCFNSKPKVNPVQEACAKCFAVHILKFEILQIT